MANSNVNAKRADGVTQKKEETSTQRSQRPEHRVHRDAETTRPQQICRVQRAKSGGAQGRSKSKRAASESGPYNDVRCGYGHG